jgi:hypothetical protein
LASAVIVLVAGVAIWLLWLPAPVSSGGGGPHWPHERTVVALNRALDQVGPESRRILRALLDTRGAGMRLDDLAVATAESREAVGLRVAELERRGLLRVIRGGETLYSISEEVHQTVGAGEIGLLRKLLQ